jgi:hypothetical protein
MSPDPRYPSSSSSRSSLPLPSTLAPLFFNYFLDLFFRLPSVLPSPSSSLDLDLDLESLTSWIRRASFTTIYPPAAPSPTAPDNVSARPVRSTSLASLPRIRSCFVGDNGNVEPLKVSIIRHSLLYSLYLFAVFLSCSLDLAVCTLFFAPPVTHI